MISEVRIDKVMQAREAIARDAYTPDMEGAAIRRAIRAATARRRTPPHCGFLHDFEH